MEKNLQTLSNKYTQQYQQFLLTPQSSRLSYNQTVHSIPMESTDLQLPQCNPTYYSKVSASLSPYLNLTLYIWEPKQNPPKNIIFLNHGMNGNIGNYQYLADKISKQTATVVIGHDARHFGRSDGLPTGLVRNFERLVEDLEIVIGWGRNKYGEKLNVFLFGLSMGGRVVIEVGNRKKYDYKGAILVAPALIASPIQTLTLGWKQYLKLFFSPESGIAKPNYTHGCRHSEFINTKVKPDPYIYQGQLLAGIVVSIYKILKNSKSVMEKFDLPYLFIQAKVDKLVDPFQIRDFEKLSQSKDKTHYYSNDMWHSCCFDKEFLEMTPDIIKWIESKSN